MGQTRFRVAALALLALLLFSHPVSAGCAADRDCCGGTNCECFISANQCHAAVSQPAPVQLETAVGLPATSIPFSLIPKTYFTGAAVELPRYAYLASFNNHPPTGPPLI
jgi:hypothetical protein